MFLVEEVGKYLMRIYRIYIDESGDHTYGKKEIKRLRLLKGGKIVADIPFDDYPQLEQDEKRYLGLTGCIIEMEEYKNSFLPKMRDLKRKHFPHDIDDPVIFHREDIIFKSGPFCILRNPEKQNAFNEDLLKFFRDTNYIIITVVIDKKSHIDQYQEYAYNPYDYCLTALMERYCGLLKFNKSKGDVLAESRGGAEDRQLKETYRHIYNNGTRYRPKEFFQNVLTSKEIKLKPKEANIPGL